MIHKFTSLFGSISRTSYEYLITTLNIQLPPSLVILKIRSLIPVIKQHITITVVREETYLLDQKAYYVTPKKQNQTIRRTKDPEWDPLLCRCVEPLGESGHRQTDTFEIMRSGGGATEETSSWIKVRKTMPCVSSSKKYVHFWRQKL